MRALRLALLLLALAPAAAGAQQPGDLERARESFKAGATAYGAGEYLAAIQAFDAAYALTPLPPIAIPLTPPAPDISLALPPLIEAIDARSRYQRDINDHQPLVPPLRPTKQGLLEQRLRQQGRN